WGCARARPLIMGGAGESRWARFPESWRREYYRRERKSGRRAPRRWQRRARETSGREFHQPRADFLTDGRARKPAPPAGWRSQELSENGFYVFHRSSRDDGEAGVSRGVIRSRCQPGLGG